ncbi:MAG: Ig-like domain-containing protein [Candidatus Eisenbacteria bacterium]
MKRGACLLALVLSGCAQMGAPPGGPVDDIPPSVVSTFPAADSTGVRPPLTAAITFSEKMDQRSVERTLRVFPKAGRLRTEWEKTTFLIETDLTGRADSLRAEPITITISGRAEDRRGNELREPFLFSFTYAESLPRGSASGTIEGLSKSAGAPPATVRAIRPAANDSTSAPVLFESEASMDGAFRIRPLPIGEEAPLLVLAFQDENENGEVDFESELYGFSDTLLLTDESPAADSLRIRLVGADTPGSLGGMVSLDGRADSLVVAALAVDDSAAAAAFAEPDSTGAYEVTDLRPGAYRVLLVRGTIDGLRLDGLESATAVVAERSLVLRPGEAKRGFDLPETPLEPQVTQ